MQGVEIRHTIRTNPNDLGIDDCGPVDPRSTLDNQRVAFRPVGTSSCRAAPDHREHGSAADSRRLQLVRPPGPVGGLAATIEQQGWMKAAGAFERLPRQLLTRCNMRSIFGQSRKYASEYY